MMGTTIVDMMRAEDTMTIGVDRIGTKDTMMIGIDAVGVGTSITIPVGSHTTVGITNDW